MACGFSPRDLNGQVQVLTARVNTLEQQVAAQALAQQALTAFAAAIPKAPGLSGILSLMGGMPGNLSSLVSFPAVPDFQAAALGIAMGMIGSIESSVISAATSQLSGVLSSAQGALSALQAAIPPDVGAIAAAQAAVDKATSAVAGAAGFATKMSNSACGLIKSSTVAP